MQYKFFLLGLSPLFSVVYAFRYYNGFGIRFLKPTNFLGCGRTIKKSVH